MQHSVYGRFCDLLVNLQLYMFSSEYVNTSYIKHHSCLCKLYSKHIFMRESSCCFQRVLAIAILSAHPSVCHTGGSVKNGAS